MILLQIHNFPHRANQFEILNKQTNKYWFFILHDQEKEVCGFYLVEQFHHGLLMIMKINVRDYRVI